MDKQMIEEMAKDVFFAGQIAGDWLMEESRKLLQEKGRFKSTEHTKTLSGIVAEELAKMGYGKIQEGAVVLPRKDYERLCDLAYFGNGEEVIRKETAKKFSIMVIAKGTIYTGLREKDYLQIDVDDIDEICKEITGG